jgi:hypothetical protein
MRFTTGYSLQQICAFISLLTTAKGMARNVFALSNPIDIASEQHILYCIVLQEFKVYQCNYSTVSLACSAY